MADRKKRGRGPERVSICVRVADVAARGVRVRLSPAAAMAYWKSEVAAQFHDKKRCLEEQRSIEKMRAAVAPLVCGAQWLEAWDEGWAYPPPADARGARMLRARLTVGSPDPNWRRRDAREGRVLWPRYYVGPQGECFELAAWWHYRRHRWLRREGLLADQERRHHGTDPARSPAMEALEMAREDGRAVELVEMDLLPDTEEALRREIRRYLATGQTADDYQELVIERRMQMAGAAPPAWAGQTDPMDQRENDHGANQAA